MKSQLINIQENIPLAPFTTFKIGGPAKYFVEVSAEDELLEAVEFARKNNLEIFVLSGGSNILVSDQGFDGLVIKLEAQNSPPKAPCLPAGRDQSLVEKFIINCWAGNNLSEIVKYSLENSLTGLEWAAGIPGTIGGAVRGSAGAYGVSMADAVKEVKVLEISNFQNYKNKDCKFSYRNSIFKQNQNLIIVSCVLELKKGDKTEIENKIKEIIKKRTEKIPKGLSAGSFFQNPTVENKELIESFKKDTGMKCQDGKIPAGWLIEEAGLKGKKMGGVAVSEKHANFVINKGQGTAEDVIILANFIKQQVRSKLGVQLREEIQYVGF